MHPLPKSIVIRTPSQQLPLINHAVVMNADLSRVGSKPRLPGENPISNMSNSGVNLKPKLDRIDSNLTPNTNNSLHRIARPKVTQRIQISDLNTQKEAKKKSFTRCLTAKPGQRQMRNISQNAYHNSVESYPKNNPLDNSVEKGRNNLQTASIHG